MTQLTANFEAGTNGNNILASDPGSANAWDLAQHSGTVAQLQYSNTHSYGTLSCRCNAEATASACWLEWNTALGTVTDHYGRAYIYWTAHPSTSATLFQCLSTSTLSTQILLNISGQFVINDNTGAVFTFTNAIAVNQWVRYEYHIVHSATIGQIEIKLFNNSDSSTATETKTSAANRNTLASGNTVRYGQISSPANNVSWLDNIVAGAASYPGPDLGQYRLAAMTTIGP